MSNIHSILPLLANDSWEWGKDELNDERIPAGRSEDLFNASNIPGFLYYGLVVVTGEDGYLTEVEIDLDSFDLKTTIREAYNIGSTRPGVISPGITRYDTENDVYAVTFQPNTPLAYISNARIKVTAPSQTGVIVNSDALRLNILDERRFMESYQEATISTLLDSFGAVGEELNRTNRNLEELIDRLDERRLDRV